MNLALFVRPSVPSSVYNAGSQNWLVNFFLIFYMKLYSHEVRKVMKPDFWEKKKKKKSPDESVGPKSSKNDPKMRFCWFWQKSNSFICAFLLKYESTNGLFSAKNCMSGKNLVLEFWLKNP